MKRTSLKKYSFAIKVIFLLTVLCVFIYINMCSEIFISYIHNTVRRSGHVLKRTLVLFNVYKTAATLRSYLSKT